MCEMRYDDDKPATESGNLFAVTRPKPAYDRQGLDWIVGPGYSFVVFSTNKTMETYQKPWKPTINHDKP